MYAPECVRRAIATSEHYKKPMWGPKYADTVIHFIGYAAEHQKKADWFGRLIRKIEQCGLPAEAVEYDPRKH